MRLPNHGLLLRELSITASLYSVGGSLGAKLATQAAKS